MRDIVLRQLNLQIFFPIFYLNKLRFFYKKRNTFVKSMNHINTTMLQKETIIQLLNDCVRKFYKLKFVYIFLINDEITIYSFEFALNYKQFIKLSFKITLLIVCMFSSNVSINSLKSLTESIS